MRLAQSVRYFPGCPAVGDEGLGNIYSFPQRLAAMTASFFTVKQINIAARIEAYFEVREQLVRRYD